MLLVWGSNFEIRNFESSYFVLPFLDILAILDPLQCHANFKNSLSISTKKVSQDSNRDYVESAINLGSIAI